MANPITPGSGPVTSANATTPASTASTKATSQPTTEAPKEPSFEVTIDGQKQTLTEAQIKKLASKSGYADKSIRQAKEALRVAKAAEAEREAQMQAAKGDPSKLLKLHGIDPDEFARAVLEAKIREGQLTPEQKRIAELEASQKEAQRKLEEHDAKTKAEQQKVLVAQLQTQMENDLFEAAERAGMSRDSDSFFAIYQAVQEAHDLGLPWEPDRIIEVAQGNIESGFQKLEQATLKGLQGEALLKRLGSAVVDAVLKARVEQIRGKKTFGAKQPAEVPAIKPAAKPSEYISPAEAEARMRKLGK